MLFFIETDRQTGCYYWNLLFGTIYFLSPSSFTFRSIKVDSTGVGAAEMLSCHIRQTRKVSLGNKSFLCFLTTVQFPWMWDQHWARSFWTVAPDQRTTVSLLKLIQTLRLVLQLYVETRVTLAGFCMFWNFQQSIFFFPPTVKQYQATKPNIGLCSLESFNINMGNLKEHFDFVCSASNCVLIETARISGSMMRSVGLKCKQWLEIPKSSSWSKVEQEITSELLF